MPLMSALYLIEILHQTTTVAYEPCFNECCILSKFYIKPQRVAGEGNPQAVVSYRNSTSNHNSAGNPRPYYPLYLIEILHQTTTLTLAFNRNLELYLIEILHQTTTMSGP